MKVAVVGAGSTYTPELALALGDEGALAVDELALHDVDAGRLSVVAGFVRRLLARRASTVVVHETLDLDRALDGASFVLTQLRVGGSAGRVLDEGIPLRHGVIGQETTGAGGCSMALRTVPVVVDVAERMAAGRAAPGAHLVNFANPAGLVAEAAARAVPGVPVVGLCNIPLTFQRGFEAAFGGPVEVSSFGLNHLSWISSVVAGGQERLPGVLAALPDDGDVPGPLARALGLLPNPYVRYYHRTAAMLAAQRAAPQTRAEEVVELERAALARFADDELDDRPPELARRGGSWYCVAAVAYMRAVCGDTGERQVLNVANRGVVASLPDDAFVEVPCRVGAAGAEPLPLLPGPLPAQPLALMESVKAYERLTIEAALGGSRRVALHALLAHPLVRDLDVAEPLLDELLAAHAEHLPRFAASAARG